MCYSTCQIQSAKHNHKETTIPSAIRDYLLKEFTAFSTLKHFNLWASNELYVCLIYFSSALGAARPRFGMAGASWPLPFSHEQSLLCITVCYPNTFYVCQGWETLLCMVQITPLYNPNKGFIYMHSFIHRSTYPHAYIHRHRLSLLCIQHGMIKIITQAGTM